MNKLNKLFLKKILNEEIRLSQDSVDSQIDSVLLGMKQDSLVEHKLDRYFAVLLGEAPADELDDELAGDAGADEEGGDDEEMPDQTTGDDALDSDQPSAVKVPKIDMDMYAQKVINLYNNYQNLIEIEKVIINRAIKVLSEAGYNKNSINEFTNILDREFGISLRDDEEGSDIPMRPIGGSAGPVE